MEYSSNFDRSVLGRRPRVKPEHVGGDAQLFAEPPSIRFTYGEGVYLRGNGSQDLVGDPTFTRRRIERDEIAATVDGIMANRPIWIEVAATEPNAVHHAVLPYRGTWDVHARIEPPKRL